MALRPSDDFDRDILDIIPERYDADADSHEARAGHRLRGIVTIVAAVVAVGAIVAVGLHFIGGRKGASDGVPVIKAEDRPFKMRPDDRGGMQVPNQDKLVYERMESGSETDGRVERLLPPPESPKAPPRPSATPTETLTLPQAPAALPQSAVAPAPLPVAPAVPGAAPAVPVPVPAAPAGSALAPPPPVSSYQPVQTRAAPASPAAPAPAPAAAAPTAKPTASPAPAKPQVITPAQVANVAPPPAAVPVRRSGGGDFVVQLGAVRAADQADKEWARIQKTYADLLGGLKSDIVRVDLEGKGVFWRIRAGGLDEQSARQICADLTRRNQGCIVARK